MNKKSRSSSFFFGILWVVFALSALAMFLFWKNSVDQRVKVYEAERKAWSDFRKEHCHVQYNNLFLTAYCDDGKAYLLTYPERGQNPVLPPFNLDELVKGNYKPVPLPKTMPELSYKDYQMWRLDSLKRLRSVGRSWQKKEDLK